MWEANERNQLKLNENEYGILGNRPKGTALQTRIFAVMKRR